MPQIDYFWRCVYLIHTILSEGICGGTYQNVIKIDRKKCTESTKTGESPALLPGIPFEKKGTEGVFSVKNTMDIPEKRGKIVKSSKSALDGTGFFL